MSNSGQRYLDFSGTVALHWSQRGILQTVNGAQSSSKAYEAASLAQGLGRGYLVLSSVP